MKIGFRDLLAGPRDHRVRGIEDGLGRAMIALEAELALAELAATWVQYTSRINGTRSELGFDPGARLLRLTYGITDSRHRYHCLTRTSGELVNAV